MSKKRNFDADWVEKYEEGGPVKRREALEISEHQARRVLREEGLPVAPPAADGTHLRALGKIAKVDLLVIDDWAITPLREHDRQELLEILDDRYGAKSTVVASQLAPEHWHNYLAEPTIADAICDRLLHNAHKIKLKGPSRRKEEAKTE